jgi:pyruvate dehydrogenase E1 component alpha subunit
VSDILDADELSAIDEATAQLMEDAVREAKSAPDPTPADVLTDVYVRY